MAVVEEAAVPQLVVASLSLQEVVALCWLAQVKACRGSRQAAGGAALQRKPFGPPLRQVGYSADVAGRLGGGSSHDSMVWETPAVLHKVLQQVACGLLEPLLRHQGDYTSTELWQDRTSQAIICIVADMAVHNIQEHCQAQAMGLVNECLQSRECPASHIAQHFSQHRHLKLSGPQV